jgi:8-oxo-dGTP diphosphatase
MTANLTYPDNVIPAFRYKFCPICRAELTREILFDDNIPRVHCPACGWIVTLSNVIAVATVVKSGNGIVAILPPDVPADAPAALPAGLVEYGESPEEAAIRETHEETGLNIEIVRSLGWSFCRNFEEWPGPMVYVMFEAQAIGGELRGSDEGKAKIFTLQEFPPILPKRHGSWMAMQAYLSNLKG